MKVRVLAVGLADQVDRSGKEACEGDVQRVLDADVDRVDLRKEREEDIGAAEVGAALSG